MKVILLNNIKKIGSRFDTVEVADGFAQNFLIPQKKALPATPEHLANIDQIKSGQAEEIAQERQEIQNIIAELEGQVVQYTTLANENGVLYESVQTADIAQALKDQKGVDLDEVYMTLETPIKNVGEFSIPVNYDDDLSGAFTLNIISDDIEK